MMYSIKIYAFDVLYYIKDLEIYFLFQKTINTSIIRWTLFYSIHFWISLEKYLLF